MFCNVEREILNIHLYYCCWIDVFEMRACRHTLREDEQCIDSGYVEGGRPIVKNLLSMNSTVL
jgi:hypothetical protein